MNYRGYLIKVGSYEIPMKYIATDSYKVTPLMREDLDPYRDANGYLHRNVVSSRPSKIEIKTPYMFARAKCDLMANIKAQYTNEAEKKCNVTFYDDENDRYITEVMYIPDVEMNIYMYDPDNYDKTIYQPFTLKFIGYGKRV